MKTNFYGLIAETQIHSGSGQDGGLIDKPVAREAATDYPVVFGSSVKGALRDIIFWKTFQEPNLDKLDEAGQKLVRDQARKDADRAANTLFGEADNAGPIIPSDIRLLLLPTRSLSASYYWLTCPHLLERLERDWKRAGVGMPDLTIPRPEEGKYCGAASGKIYLEERTFDKSSQLFAPGLIDALKALISHRSVQDRLANQLLVIHDNDFAWFARYGLPVTARNCLNSETKASENLWYEETWPTDTVAYLLLTEREAGSLAKFEPHLSSGYLRVGGNETIGQGWFALQQIVCQNSEDNNNGD